MVAEFWDCLRLDPAPVQDLRKKYESHLQQGGRPVLVIDLNGVGFAGSAALGGFLAIQRANRAKGGRVIFCNVDPTVYEVFKVSKLDPLFLFTTDKPSALILAAEQVPEPPAAPDENSPSKPSASNADDLLRRSRRKPN